MRLLTAAFVVALTSVAFATERQTPPAATTPADVARMIQAHYDDVKSFTADFTRTFKGGLLPQTTVQKGTVKIRKPGRMRWTYKAPEEMEFVADGRMLYSYVKADRTCYVTDIPTGDTVSTAVLFLAGKGNLTRDFKASAAPAVSATEWRVQLTPNTPQAEFQQLILAVDRTSLKLTSMETVDADGGVSTFRFSNLRENVSLSDREFVFTPPKGVDVIR